MKLHMWKRQYIFVVLLMFLVLLFGYAVYLLLNLKNTNKEITQTSGFPMTELNDVPAGEVIVDPVPKNDLLPYDRVSFSKLWLQDYSKYFSEGSNIPLVDLKLGLKTNGIDKSFTVTLADKVFYSSPSLLTKYEATGNNIPVDVHSIQFTKGRLIDVTVAYVPEKSKVSRVGVNKHCLLTTDIICGFIPLGFGDVSIPTEKMNPQNIQDGTKFLPSDLAVWYLYIDDN